MTQASFTQRADRALVKVSGKDATKYLQNLVTCDIEGLTVGQINYGALLSPQGKILFDFFVIRTNQGYLIDTDKSMKDDFVRRLSFYKLRAEVSIEDMDDRTSIFVIWSEEDVSVLDFKVDGILASDPRNSELSIRAYIRRAPEGANIADRKQFNAWRIKLGIPHGGDDFTFGDAFPHEALMDQFNGVDFDKGCYIGQEIVSRMQHRGTARKRFVKVSSEKGLPQKGTELLVNNRVIGSITSEAGHVGLALVRTDKVGDAIRNGKSIVAATIPVELSIPEWANFDWM